MMSDAVAWTVYLALLATLAFGAWGAVDRHVSPCWAERAFDYGRDYQTGLD